MNKGLKIFLIILGEIILVAGSIFAGSILFKEQKAKCAVVEKEQTTTSKYEDVEKEQTPTSEKTNLATIQKVYNEAFDLLYEEFRPEEYESKIEYAGKKIDVHVVDQEKLAQYFTEEKLKSVLGRYSSIDFDDVYYVAKEFDKDEYHIAFDFDPYSIFAKTDGDKRTLEIIIESDTMILAKAKITKFPLGGNGATSAQGGSSYGGEYIAFKKENNIWKIEVYE